MNIEKVVIIIPTYNEALVIAETIHEVFSATAAIDNRDVHFLVYDSNSRDNTQQIVQDLQTQYPRLHLKTEQQKSGLGSAYMQAMRYALSVLQADIVFEFDADLSHQPKYIAPMLELMNTHDVVIGSRYVPGGSIPKEWGWHRQLFSVLGNYVARFVLSAKYKDFTSGFRATHRSVLEKVLPEKFLSNQYAYKMHLLWLLHQHKAKICEYPIEFVDRQKGVSKLPTNSVLDSLRVVFTLRFQSLKGYLKMCMVGLSGAVVQILVYNLLRQSWSPLSAVKVAMIAAIINNFVLNHRFTFKEIEFTSFYHKLKSLVLFIGYSILMIGVQSYWLDLGLIYLGAGPMKENITLISGILIGSLLNYLIYSRLIWRETSTL